MKVIRKQMQIANVVNIPPFELELLLVEFLSPRRFRAALLPIRALFAPLFIVPSSPGVSLSET